MQYQEVIAYCGLTCKSCPIYWVKREKNQEKQQKMKTRIAQICNEQYGSSYKAEDITDCDGCREESGTLFTGCSNCEIRRCARERKFETCAHCPEYACGNLQKLFETDPNAKIRLDIIKSVI